MRPAGEAVAESVMLPLRPRLFRLIVDDFELPATIFRLVGFAETVKPLVIVSVRASFLVIPPPVPVIVSV